MYIYKHTSGTAQLISRHEFHKFSKTKKCATNIKDDEVTEGSARNVKIIINSNCSWRKIMFEVFERAEGAKRGVKRFIVLSYLHYI